MRRLLIALPAALLAATLVLAIPAPATHRKDPPPTVLVTKAGTQRAAQESSCVELFSHEDGTLVQSMCGDTPDLPPRRLSVVRPGEVVTIAFRGAIEISDGSAAVRLLGKRRSISRFELPAPRTRWRVRLRPGAYEVELFARFRTADGRGGDTSASLGLVVDRKRKLEIVPLSAARPPPAVTGRAVAVRVQGEDERAQLSRAPAKVRRACVAEQRESEFRVLCPTVLPRSTHPPAIVDLYRWPRTRASWYGISLTYKSSEARNRFHHVELLGGYWKGDDPAWSMRAWLGTGKRLLGTTTLGGERGRLYEHPPYSERPGVFAGHFTFIWKNGEITYAASLHKWRPDRETRRALGEFIAGLAKTTRS